MIMKSIYNDCIECVQIAGFHQEGKMGDEDFYMEITYPNESTITVNNTEVADPECIMDLDYTGVEKTDKVHMAIYTDAMVELVTIFKNF